MLLAGIGVCDPIPSSEVVTLTKVSQHVTSPPDSQRNFLIVDQKTEDSAIEKAFDSFTHERKDIAILLINQHVRRVIVPHPQWRRACTEPLLTSSLTDR